MLKKAIISLGICFSLFLLWFAAYNYSEAGPIAEENLRGLALSLTSAIENLAVHDPSFAALSRFHAADVAYFALIDRRGVYRFHSNPDLIGTAAADDTLPVDFHEASPSEARVTLGTGEHAFQFTTPMSLAGEPLLLRLTLHTYRADTVIRRARLDMTILVGMLATGWMLSVALFRYARREELHQVEMARKESLAKLGEMGATLAHEIRNPLAGIKGFAQVIARRPQEQRNSGFAHNIVTEAVRLENLVSDLLAYAASDATQKTPFDLGGLLEDVTGILAGEALDQQVAMVNDWPAELFVSGNRDRLEQALLNLGKNALQAMPEGGTLTFAAEISGGNAVVTVRDTGHGIAEQDLPRVLDPFFTTKARGTGLGLAVCRKIVEEHRGSIDLKSAPGEGTAVTITLPAIGAKGEGLVAKG